MLENLIGQSSAFLNSDFIAIAMVKDRNIIWANVAMHRIFGYEPDELLRQPTRNLFLDQISYEEFGNEAYSAFAEGRTYAWIIPQMREDGTTGWFECNISALAGLPDISVGAIVDRTTEHQAILQLEHSELHYRSVVEDQTEAISRFLPDNTFLFVYDAT